MLLVEVLKRALCLGKFQKTSSFRALHGGEQSRGGKRASKRIHGPLASDREDFFSLNLSLADDVRDGF